MERKEHPVPVIQAAGEYLEFLDSDGNPFKPDEPVHYQIVGEDGSILKEGDLSSDDSKVSTADLGTKKFAIFVDNFIVGETEGFEPIEESVEAERPNVDLGEGRDFGAEMDWERAGEGRGDDNGTEESGDDADTPNPVESGDEDSGGDDGKDAGDDSGEKDQDDEISEDSDSAEGEESGLDDSSSDADDSRDSKSENEDTEKADSSKDEDNSDEEESSSDDSKDDESG